MHKKSWCSADPQDEARHIFFNVLLGLAVAGVAFAGSVVVSGVVVIIRLIGLCSR